MILVADSGSTITDWGMISDDGSVTYFSTSGYTPFFMDSDSLCHVVLTRGGRLPGYRQCPTCFFSMVQGAKVTRSPTWSGHCAESTDYHFDDLLKIEAERHGVKVGLTLPAVIEELTLYHRRFPCF